MTGVQTCALPICAGAFADQVFSVAPGNEHLEPPDRRVEYECVKNYFSSGCGPYYRYHHGENLLSPRQQEDIMNILARYGSTEGLAFDHYVTDFDFG